jgi:CheY-like chemotaxis protein
MAQRFPTEKKVLIVEDEEDLRAVLRELLEGLGMAVDEASNGREGLNAILDHPGAYAAVLTDVRMPVLDGISMLRNVRAVHPHSPPIIVVSGFSDTSDTEIMKLGATSVIQKPYDLATIEAVLARVFDLNFTN